MSKTFPCGARQALVPVSSGCEHWRPAGTPASGKLLDEFIAFRNRVLRDVRNGLPSPAYHLLKAIAESPSGEIVLVRSGEVKGCASYLRRKGLLEHLGSPRSGRYALTGDGRAMYAQIAKGLERYGPSPRASQGERTPGARESGPTSAASADRLADGVDGRL